MSGRTLVWCGVHELKYAKDVPWLPAETIPPGNALDVIVARFMGHEVKSLSEWGEEWYPAIVNRSTLMRGAWFVPDNDAQHEEEYRPGVEGEWLVHGIEEYSTDALYAWLVYERILRDYDPSATIHRNEIGLWRDYMGPREVITGLSFPHAISLVAKHLWGRSAKPIGPVAR